ncbi:hypothetical protein WA026_004150 [Henosepilachna vigintioctopunctata]|uniref:Uncharacterized protein n=1 Tax=Henosepilachna vigintioctopunctata TaxID=420089 RepID=A0AAW1U6I0_9CUCU
MQYKEQIKTLDDNEQSTLENMIGDQNENNLNEIHDNTIDVSEYLNSRDTVERKNFQQIKENIINLTENLNRPTSIVTPFMQIKKCSMSKNEPRDDNSNNVSINTSVNGNEAEFHTNIQENALKNDEIFSYSTNELGENHKNKFIETSINYFTSLASGKEMNDEKRSTHEYLADDIGHNYVENLKAILIAKMNPQQENHKNVKDFINASNKLKYLNEYGEFQDENNNEFKHESPVTSSICSDHIAQEVEHPIAQSFGEKTLSERRKFFTRQQCLSVSSSSNSSFSEREKEDVCEQLDGHKYNLSVLTVIDTIKKSTNTHVLNRNTSMSVPNISKENIEDHNSLFICFKCNE